MNWVRLAELSPEDQVHAVRRWIRANGTKVLKEEPFPAWLHEHAKLIHHMVDSGIVTRMEDEDG